MVREQLVARGIRDPQVLAAMNELPRHLFVPEAMRQHAYEDAALPIGYGQSISQPYIVARMSELLEPASGLRVLEIGTGSGYQAAVLAKIGCTVFSLERIREMHQQSTMLLRTLRLRTIHTQRTDGTYGLPQAAPFERIIVTAGAPELPEPLLGQLAEGGILLIPVGAQKREQRLLRMRKKCGKIYQEDFGPVAFVDLVGAHGW